jgi:hypothetical protein
MIYRWIFGGSARMFVARNGVSSNLIAKCNGPSGANGSFWRKADVRRNSPVAVPEPKSVSAFSVDQP